MGRIAIVFAIIIIAGIGLYVFNASSPSTRTTFFQSLLPHYPSSTPYSYVAPVIAPPSHDSGNIITSAPASPTNPPAPIINPADIPPGFTPSQLSPYFHEVRFGGISPASSYSYGQIMLSAYPSQYGQATTTIDVSGWQIKTNRGGEYLPQAVALYDPTGLAPATDIRLKNGDYLYLYSSSAPVNLRLNKCLGYLPDKTQFNPQLPQNCPYLDRSAIQSFSGACQNYINSIGGCQSPDLSSPYIPQNDYACLDYLNTHFNYRSCFNEHIGDPDFSLNEVRAWMGSSPVDQFHDTVLLFDRSGLLVDFYSY